MTFVRLGFLLAAGAIAQGVDQAEVSIPTIVQNGTLALNETSLELSPQVLATFSQKPALRGSLQAMALPLCSQAPNYQTAFAGWCGNQAEPFACYKDPSEASWQNLVWDCHISNPPPNPPCSLGGHLCSWTGTQPASPPPPAPSPAPGPVPPGTGGGGAATRFLTYNLLYLGLPGRVAPVVDTIRAINPEIAALEELWFEKPALLARIREVYGGPVWDFAVGGPSERYNDADILYRSDIWENLDCGILPYGADRGMNWAMLRRHTDQAYILVVGTHPICCQGDEPILEAVEFVMSNAVGIQDRWSRRLGYTVPIVLLGDLNTGYFEASMALLRTDSADGFGRHWSMPATASGMPSFYDAWAELHPSNPNPSTINNEPVRIDYVYFQKGTRGLGPPVSSQVWSGMPGGSDHRPVSGDAVITAQR